VFITYIGFADGNQIPTILYGSKKLNIYMKNLRWEGFEVDEQ
jgi:hypothetical protein